MPRLTPSTLRRSSAKSTPSPDDAKYDNALTLLAAARESYGAGDHQSAITKVNECLTLCRTIKDADKRKQIESHAIRMADAARTNLAAEALDAGNALNRKGEVGFARGKYEEALAIGLAIANANTQKKVLGPAHGSLGNACRQARQFDQAIAHHEAALAIAREVGNRRGASEISAASTIFSAVR